MRKMTLLDKMKQGFIPLLGWIGFTVLGCIGASTAQAGYSVLGGAPVTQGQMLISDEDYNALPAPNKAVGAKFSLQETRVEADISGVLARVRVSQVFRNPHSNALEALYVFPLPENSAVDAYSFQIGERIIVGEVKEREEAKQIYQQARQEGRKAALLEQERANIFTQSVANIPANSEVVIHIEYVQPLEVDEDRYLFRFPMVVGRRYIPGNPVSRPNVGRGWANDTDEVPDASRITAAKVPDGMRNGNDVFIQVNVDGAMPIQAITPVTHELDVSRRSETQSVVTLKNGSVIADKDFIFEYQLASEQTTLASMTHRISEEEDGYVMLALQPKWSVEASEITPREVHLVMDVSGSMRGPAISQMRLFAEQILDHLNPGDSIKLISFSQQATTFRDSPVPADASNIEAAKEFVRRLKPNGGTNLLSALRVSLGESQTETSLPRYLILMTDALVGNDHSILRYLQEDRFSDARVFPIAFGAAPNDYLMNRAAEMGRGFAMQVTNQDNSVAIAKHFNALTNLPYMTDLHIDWGDLNVKDQVPARLPDLFAGKPLIVLGRYDQAATSTVRLKGNVLGSPVEMELDLELPAIEPAHDSISSVWARQRIRQIWNRNVGKETKESRAEITELGLRHQLVTAYTSFIAVETEADKDQEGQLITDTDSLDPADPSSESASRPAKKPLTDPTAQQPANQIPSAGSAAQSNPSQASPSVNRAPDSSSSFRPSSGSGGGGAGGGPIGPISALLSLAGAGAASMMRRKK